MMVLGNLLVALAPVVHTVFQIAWFVLLARIVFSWIQPNPRPGLVRSVISGVYQVTDPVLDGTRRLLPFLRIGALDLSPIALFLALGFADRFLTSTLYDVGYALT
ncbi:MAG: YggT family protein [Alphaproteobacteria bacterium]|nr:YggT family protein [Alphaproteobacteria bacterium]